MNASTNECTHADSDELPNCCNDTQNSTMRRLFSLSVCVCVCVRAMHVCVFVALSVCADNACGTMQYP